MEQAVAANPVRERVRAQLMLALYRCGREVEALQTYQQYRLYLAEELGLEPSGGLRRLEEQILQHDADLDWAAPASEPAVAPVPPERALPTGTVTFLFTDLEDSTRLWDEHPTEMNTALACHDAMLRDLIAKHGGHVVKTTGDGVHAVFAAAPDAVAMAIDALQAIESEAWGAMGPLAARIGMHTGIAELRDGDYYGTVVNRASRLMAAAHPGQAILSQTSAELVRDSLTDELGLLDLGEHRLRGPRPRRARVSVGDLRAAFAVPTAAVGGCVPRQSAVSPHTVCARRPTRSPVASPSSRCSNERGRAQQTARRQVALVAGEPGIGKTRLVGELARHAYAHGAVVLYGRCDEEAIMPYQPFVEALRPYVAACPTSTLREWLHGLEGDLARAFPEFVRRMPELSVSAANEPLSPGVVERDTQQAERYRLFEAFTTLVTGIAATQPAVLVLDDVHWADQPTLQLLRHLFRSAPRAALLVVACYRDVEVARGASNFRPPC